MADNVKEKITQFFSNYPLKKVSKNQILIYGGENPEKVMHILSGKVRQYDISSKGEEIILTVFKPPAFFPMSWAINGGTNNYFFETLTDVELRIAPPEDTVRFLLKNPDVMLNLLSRLYSGMDGVLRRMTQLMGGNAKSRLVLEIMLEIERFGEKTGENSYKININESELATRTGMSRETISRQMSSLKEDKLIVITRSGLVINDYNNLKAKLEQFF